MKNNSKNKSIFDTHNIVNADELKDILNMYLDTINTSSSETYDTLPPILVRGSPGCGKSTIVKNICIERNIDFIDVRLPQMEPCDIKGLPVPNRENNTMDWFVNGTWPRDLNGKGIIFLDEITSADRSIQVAAYELILDRRLGKLYQVPPGYLIVAAGNLTTDKAVAMTMSSALANRFMHIELKENAEDWLIWARTHNIHPAVIGFITYKPNMLFNMENENLETGWPSPRSWERVSQICHMYNQPNDNLLRKMVYGLIGIGTGIEFIEFYKLNTEFDNIINIMLDPTAEINIPEQDDRKYALCTSMVYMLWKGKDKNDEEARLSGFYRICMELSSDFAAMTLSAAMHGKDINETKYRCGLLIKHKSYIDWKKKFGSSLQKYIDVKNIFNS